MALSNQAKKSDPETNSRQMGINLWLAPQISEHWPKNRPGRWLSKLTWFSRPGHASAFTPILGTAHECSTSVDPISIRIPAPQGRTVRLSVSNKRAAPPSLSGTMYASNSTPSPRIPKSEYSYDQYHWCPIVFTVSWQSAPSSREYSNRRDGMAI